MNEIVECISSNTLIDFIIVHDAYLNILEYK